ncbi:hypothetical protein V8G54_033620 [Vigna mungo]|uniref:Uncharacterized protein n=1 Tax=Vigna mungo TaxID=3915 RepID=A0AAQ3MNQ3_VIGMU
MAGEGQALWDRIQPEPIRNITHPNVFDGAATYTYHPQIPQIVKNNTSEITTFSFNSFSTKQNIKHVGIIKKNRADEENEWEDKMLIECDGMNERFDWDGLYGSVEGKEGSKVQLGTKFGGAAWLPERCCCFEPALDSGVAGDSGCHLDLNKRFWLATEAMIAAAKRKVESLQKSIRRKWD